MERELGDDEQRAADVVERAVHLPGVVVEDAKADDLATEEVRLGRRIARGDAEEHAETVSDGADHLAVDRHPRLAHALHHRSHARVKARSHLGVRVARRGDVG